MKKQQLILVLCISALTSGLSAQDGKPPGGGPGGPGGGREGKRPVPPIIAALDLNKDGTIDADEIAKAAESLKKLDKNNDGKLTEDEIRPPRPEGQGGPGKKDGADGGDKKGPREKGGPGDGQGRPPRPDGAKGGPEGKRPAPPIVAALDLNKDGTIDADEITKAPESLKKLDKNNDGKLTEDELHPPRPDGQGGPEGKGPRERGPRPGGPKGPAGAPGQ